MNDVMATEVERPINLSILPQRFHLVIFVYRDVNYTYTSRQRAKERAKGRRKRVKKSEGNERVQGGLYGGLQGGQGGEWVWKERFVRAKEGCDV